MRSLKVFSIVIGVLLVVTIIFCWIYFVSQFSSTFEPLKEYKYATSIYKFEKSLKDLKTDSHFTYKNIETTGSKEVGFKYYFTIIFKKSDSEKYEYNLNYEEGKKIWKNSISLKLNLVGAFDKINNTGGYKIEDENVPRLIKIFESDILPKMQDSNSH